MKKFGKLVAALCLALCLTMASTALPIIPGVTPVALAATNLTKTKATLYVGKTLQLRINKAGLKVKKWTSSKKTVATVSKTGLVTAVKAGKATITATVGTKKYTCKVTVKEPIVVNVDVKLPKTFKEILSDGHVGTKYKITKVRCTYTEDPTSPGMYRIDIAVAGKKTYDIMLDLGGEEYGSIPMFIYKLYKGKKLMDKGTVYGPEEVYTGQSWSLKSSWSCSDLLLDSYVFKPGTYTLKLENYKW